MPVKDQAAYMREYRAKKKAKPFLMPAVRQAIKEGFTPEKLTEAMKRVNEKDERIAFLEGEVARLKRELALTHTLVGPLTTTRSGTIDTRPRLGGSFGRSYPAPKTGKK